MPGRRGNPNWLKDKEEDTPDACSIEKRRGNPAWVPGVSGNPSGARNRTAAQIARLHVEKAINTLVAMLDCDDWQQRGWAAEKLLDRGYGKPVERKEVDVTSGPLLIGAQPLDQAMWIQAVAEIEKRRSLLDDASLGLPEGDDGHGSTPGGDLATTTGTTDPLNIVSGT